MTTNENIKLLDKALLSIIEMDDVDTLNEQFDAIQLLSKLRAKLTTKQEEAK
jgi:hypothetical protein